MRFLHYSRNNTLINVHTGLQRYANKTLDVFGFVYFLSVGISFTVVSLVWSASFILRFFLRPVSFVICQKIGLKRSLAYGTLFSSSLFLVYLGVDGINVWLFVFVVFAALYDIFYWLPYASYYSVSGDHDDRGKQLAAREVFIQTIQISVPLLGGLLATTAGFKYLYISAAACMVLAAIPVFFADDVHPGDDMTFKDAVREIDMRGFMMSVGDGIETKAYSVLWTVVLYYLVDNFVSFGWLLSFEILATTVLSFALGHVIDKGNGIKVERLAMVLIAGVVIARSFWVHTTTEIVIVNLFAAVGTAFYGMAYVVALCNTAKKSHNALWYHFFAESGWDIGAAFTCLAAAGLFAAGIPVQKIMLLALVGLVIVHKVLRSYYTHVPATNDL